MARVFNTNIWFSDYTIWAFCFLPLFLLPFLYHNHPTQDSRSIFFSIFLVLLKSSWSFRCNIYAYSFHNNITIQTLVPVLLGSFMLLGGGHQVAPSNVSQFWLNPVSNLFLSPYSIFWILTSLTILLSIKNLKYIWIIFLTIWPQQPSSSVYIKLKKKIWNSSSSLTRTISFHLWILSGYYCIQIIHSSTDYMESIGCQPFLYIMEKEKEIFTSPHWGKETRLFNGRIFRAQSQPP